MDFSENQIVEILTETIDALYKKYNWYGKIEIDILPTYSLSLKDFGIVVNLKDFLFYQELKEKYKNYGYDPIVLINFLHSLISINLNVYYFNFFSEKYILRYYDECTYIMEINEKTIKYKLPLIK